MSSNLIPQTKLHGIAFLGDFPTISKKGLLSEKYQKKTADYLQKNNGVWPWMVKASNQVFYQAFNQISANSSTSVACTKEGGLFQPMYLTSFNRTKPYSEKKLGNIPEKVKNLQDILAKRGVSLITLVSPNRIALYPEILPEGYVDRTRLGRQNSYDVLPERFNKLGVNIIDMFQFFLEHRNGAYGEGEVFPPTASHWNEVASCVAVNSIYSKLSALKSIKLPQIECDKFELKMPPTEADTDLLEIANLLFPARLLKPSPVVIGGTRNDGTPESNIKRPRILLIGTSFLFAIQKNLEKHKLAEKSPLFFYYRQTRDVSTKSFHNLRKNFNWEKDILSYDAIVIESNQASIGKIGHGFVDHALKYFRQRDAQEK